MKSRVFFVAAIMLAGCGGGSGQSDLPDALTDIVDTLDTVSADSGQDGDVARDVTKTEVDGFDQDSADQDADLDADVQTGQDIQDSGPEDADPDVIGDAGFDQGPQGDVLDRVPGSVVYWRISPEFRIIGPDLIYTTSPSIVLLPDGDYLLSFNLFGNALVPPADESGTTYIYRSSDKGETWTCLTPEPMMDMKRGSLFVHDGAVYIWGYTAAPGKIIIRKSTDNGDTWTSPVDGETGLLTETTHGGTPFNPVFVNDRIWMAVSGKGLMSVPDDADLLSAAAWAGPSASANTSGSPLGDDLTITEAQIVGSPSTGAVVMPKIGGLPNTVLIRAAGDAAVGQIQLDDWVALPGGDKKFGAGYDSVSKKFWVLSNPVLPADADQPDLTPQLIRNTAALLSSDDLWHWDVRQLFLYSPHVDYEAFQYFNFDIEGDDMIIASRTAFDITPVGLFKPPRGHDSNMITFHRIPDFRNAGPEHYLVISEGEVLRYERTQHADAPLGRFILGSIFDDQTLDTVTGITDDDATVLVRENRGRVLRFDLGGNFMETVTGFAGGFETESLFVDQPTEGYRTWVVSGDGDWADLENWYYWGRPDTGHEDAHFGSAADEPITINLDREYRVRGMEFSGSAGYALTGAGGLYVEPVTGNGAIAVWSGSNVIDVPARLAGHLDVEIEPGSELVFQAGLNLSSVELILSGGGSFVVKTSFDMGTGWVVVDGTGTLVFEPGVTVDLTGTIELKPVDGADVTPGSVFTLFKGAENLAGTFTTVLLPDLGPDRFWDQSNLYVDGTVSVVGI